LAGTVPDTAARTALHGTELDTEFGWSVAVVPDVNGDSYPEMVIGAPESTLKGSGAVYGMLGPWSTGSYDVEAEARALYGATVDGVPEELGFTLVAGDAGLDGRIEILISAMGSSRVYAVSVSDWLLD
jgi:hypothetical protein